MMFPIKHLSKSIAFILCPALSKLISQTDINISFWVSVLSNKSQNFLSELRNTEICKSTENLSKSALKIRAFVVDWVQGKIQQFVKKSSEHVRNFFFKLK